MNKLKNTHRNYLIKMAKDNPKEFILEFFKDSNIRDEKGVLIISDVEKDFEEFVGKKSPYKFVFDFNLHNDIRDSELILQGSYFLLAIRDYLSNKGETSLLKININPDLNNISKNLLKNSNILESNFSNFEFLFEFSFLSNYQYLNEKKQSINKILVKGKKVIDINLINFKIQNGKKEEIPNIELDQFYKIAKTKLDDRVIKETKTIKTHLKEKLDKELNRVKDHYLKQIKEKDEEVEVCARKIKLLQSKLRHTNYERDINILNMQIRESKVRLENLKKKGYKERLKAEETFHIKDEVEKQVLSIKNRLINATLFYYPIYNLKVSSKGKIFSMKYDPIFDKIL